MQRQSRVGAVKSPANFMAYLLVIGCRRRFTVKVRRRRAPPYI
jgi:hypothetical protein